MYSHLRWTFVALVALVAATPGRAHAAEAQWVSLALEITDQPSEIDEATVSSGAARLPDRAQAVAEALSRCKQRSKNPQNCRTLETFSAGCKYLSTGKAPWGTAGWATDYTPQAAYDRCHSRDLNCGVPVGGCADPAINQGRENIAFAPPVPHWAALAVGHDGNLKIGGHGVATRTGQTKEDAQRYAVMACNRADPTREISCKAVAAFNHGCGYIITSDQQSPYVGWGYGPTLEEARRHCTKNGRSCNTKPVSYCIEQ